MKKLRQVRPGTFSTNQLHHVLRLAAWRHREKGMVNLTWTWERSQRYWKMSAGLAACFILPIWKTQKWTYMVFMECLAGGISFWVGNCTWFLPLIYQGGGLDDCGIVLVLVWFVLCSSIKDLTAMARHTYVLQKETSQGVFCMYLISNCDKAAKGR